MSRRRKKLPVDPVETKIESLSHEGRGVSHIDGKTVFIDGALPGETVRFRYKRMHSRYAEGTIEEIISGRSENRVEAKCAHFSVCGGCSLQHLAAEKQLQHKQDVLLEQFHHLGGVQAPEILPLLTGPLWGYRSKARLGVKHVIKKDRVLVGFREKYSAYLADIDTCEVLHPSVGGILNELAALIADLTVYNKIAQIEVAVSEQTTVLIFRNLAELSSEDLSKLYNFGKQHNLSLYLQPGGSDTVTHLSGETQHDLSYKVDDDQISIHYAPTDFTQVNVEINQKMVERVIALMEIDAGDKILDLFCGLGNFTLPLARRAQSVTGIDAANTLIKKAEENARLNNIANVNFFAADLFQLNLPQNIIAGQYDKLLLDPPRSGAKELLPQMNMNKVNKVVYVSCNPATLARDAGILVKEKGFKLKSAGVMDMFPHTTHVESIAVFEK